MPLFNLKTFNNAQVVYLLKSDSEHEGAYFILL